MALGILVVAGACGAGKSTLVLSLQELNIKGVKCFILDWMEDKLPNKHEG